MTKYEIQTRQKGAWMRWIGHPNKSVIDTSWGHIQGRRYAARLVQITDGVLKVLATKAKGDQRQQHAA